MPKPEDFKGSDLKARAEIVQWLHDHGTEVHDPTGLLAGRMRDELGKGRGMSQLLTEMDKDGMIEREVRGRRTFMIKLLDDWGLLSDLRRSGYREVPKPKVKDEEQIDLTGVDYDQLAMALLMQVVKRAQVQPSQGARAEKLADEVAALKAERQELRDALILARETAKEHQDQADRMRKSIVKLQAQMDKSKTENVPIRERLPEATRKELDKLMRELPTSR